MSQDASSSAVAGPGKIRVTFQVPRDAANHLLQLFDNRWPGLAELGIVSVQLGGNKEVAPVLPVHTASSCSSLPSQNDCDGSSLPDQESVKVNTGRTRRRAKKRRKADCVSENPNCIDSFAIAKEIGDRLLDASATASCMPTGLHKMYHAASNVVTSIKNNGQLGETDCIRATWHQKQNMQISPTNAELYAYSIVAPNSQRLQACAALNGVNYSNYGSTVMSRDCLSKQSPMSEVSPFLVNLLQNEPFVPAAQGDIHRQISNMELPPPATSFVPKRRQSKKRRMQETASQLNLNQHTSCVTNIVSDFIDYGGVKPVQLKLPLQLAGKPVVYNANSQQLSCSTQSSFFKHNEKQACDSLDGCSTESEEVREPAKYDETNLPNMTDKICRTYAAGYHQVPYSTSEMNISTTFMQRFPLFSPDKVNRECVNQTESTENIAKLHSVTRLPNGSVVADTSSLISYSACTNISTSKGTSLSIHMPDSCEPMHYSSSVLNGDASSMWSSRGSSQQCQYNKSGSVTQVTSVDWVAPSPTVNTNNETSPVTKHLQSLCISPVSNVEVHGISLVGPDSGDGCARMHDVIADNCVVPAADLQHPRTEMLFGDASHQQISSDHSRKSNDVSIGNISVPSPTLHTKAVDESLSDITDLGTDKKVVLSVPSISKTENRSGAASGVVDDDHNYLKCVEYNGIGPNNGDMVTSECDVSGVAVESSVQKLLDCRPLLEVKDSSKTDDVSVRILADTLREDSKSRVVNGIVKSVETIECEDSRFKTERRTTCDSVADDMLLVAGAQQPMNDNFLKCHLDSRFTLVTSNKL